ncbi:MAG: hypothetical protein ACYDHN_00560 [Solirubrobacteraceae bacterium]
MTLRSACKGYARLFSAGVIACGVFSALPTSAGAALISTGACNSAELSTPFARWGDPSSYEALPGGNFEGSLAGWSLTGGAHTVDGSEPFDASGPGSKSLLLTPGSTVTSAPTCVNASYPTFRFFAHNSSLLSTVLVQVVGNTALGPLSQSLGVVALSGSWRPTPVMLTDALVGGALSGGGVQISIRLTALTGSTQVDDIFIDPRMTH